VTILKVPRRHAKFYQKFNIKNLIQSEMNMEEKSESIQIAYYLDILFRRRWFVIIPFCIVVIAGMILAVNTPQIFKASTLILVQAQRVPAEYVRPLVSEELESRIASISQHIKSRSNLEQIINKFKLYAGPDDSGMFMEDKVERLRQNISVEVFSDRRRGTSAEAFSISFKGKDPEIVMRVTNDIAESFINENLRIREEEAVGTSDFLEDQLVLTRLRLEELDQRLRTFRMENMGGLPEQLDTNLRILDRLQMQTSQKQENLREAKQRQILLNNQVAEMESFRQTIAGYSSSAGTGVGQNNPYVRLQNMKEELDQLTSRYTESHPDILRLKQRVVTLERQIKEGVVPASGNRADADSQTMMHPVLLDRQNILKQQGNEIKLEIEKLEAENQKLTEQIAFYQALVEETPKKEQELMGLKRDYENIQKSYNSLLERRMQAQLAVNLEKTKRGEQFRILDRAQIPVKPSEPDMKKIFIMTIAAALGLGGGIVFLLEFMDSSVRQKKDIESMGIPVLVSIPKIETPKDLKWVKTNNILTVCSLMFAMVLCSGFALLVLKGVDPAVEMLRRVAG
jgi:polysaccharide chain length determinant protein (PEP-CTERM system associated)